MRIHINKYLAKLNLKLFRIFPREFEKFAVKGENLIGAEVGVYRGDHALSMLKTLNIKKIFLIDNYPPGYDGFEDLPEAQDIAIKKLKPFESVNFMFRPSQIAVEFFEDNSLDFVYLDGCHDYKSKKEDIEEYYKKVKVGGVLGGHDFWNYDNKFFDGTIRAVMEFCIKNKLQLHCGGISGDFWMVKK